MQQTWFLVISFPHTLDSHPLSLIFHSVQPGSCPPGTEKTSLPEAAGSQAGFFCLRLNEYFIQNLWASYIGWAQGLKVDGERRFNSQYNPIARTSVAFRRLRPHQGQVPIGHPPWGQGPGPCLTDQSPGCCQDADSLQLVLDAICIASHQFLAMLPRIF